jgi:hypothetical protein
MEDKFTLPRKTFEQGYKSILFLNSKKIVKPDEPYEFDERVEPSIAKILKDKVTINIISDKENIFEARTVKDGKVLVEISDLRRTGNYFWLYTILSRDNPYNLKYIDRIDVDSKNTLHYYKYFKGFGLANLKLYPRFNTNIDLMLIWISDIITAYRKYNYNEVFFIERPENHIILPFDISEHLKFYNLHRTGFTGHTNLRNDYYLELENVNRVCQSMGLKEINFTNPVDKSLLFSTLNYIQLRSLVSMINIYLIRYIALREKYESSDYLYARRMNAMQVLIMIMEFLKNPDTRFIPEFKAEDWLYKIRFFINVYTDRLVEFNDEALKLKKMIDNIAEVDLIFMHINHHISLPA